jgi:phosphoribosylanthranilate isomerase
MEPVDHPRVKICCIRSVEEARQAVRFGSSALGLVSSMPSGPGVIPDPLIREIAQTIPPGIGSFLLTSSQDPALIVHQQRRCGVNTVQICDDLRPSALSYLRSRMPGISVVQVIHVSGESALGRAREIAPFVDGILLDSGNPALPVKELGGTGRTHDWRVSRSIRESVDVPVFLAGGLTPANVASALQMVRPFAADVCTGVRTDGELDGEKLGEFFEAVRGALAS